MTPNDPRHQLELSLLCADATGLTKAFGRCDAASAFALHAFASMFVVESFRYLCRHRTVRVDFGEHRATIERARHGLKFLDDSKLAADGVLEGYGRIVEAHHRTFFDHHRGLLGPLKRLLQSDLGLFFEGSHLIGTTHLASALLGWDNERLARLAQGKLDDRPSETRQRSRVLGAYAASLLRGLGAPVTCSGPRRTAGPSRDVKAAAFYGTIVAAKSPRSMAMAMMVTSAVASSNVVLRTLPLLVDPGQEPERLFIAKWRLVVATHLASSLHRLATLSDSTTLLRPHVHRAIVEVGTRARAVEKFRRLRNTFVHYAVHVGRDERPPATLQQLLEGISGAPFPEVQRQVDAVLDDIATSLSRLLPGLS